MKKVTPEQKEIIKANALKGISMCSTAKQINHSESATAYWYNQFRPIKKHTKIKLFKELFQQGIKVSEIARQTGFSQSTLANWKRKYFGTTNWKETKAKEYYKRGFTTLEVAQMLNITKTYAYRLLKNATDGSK